MSTAGAARASVSYKQRSFLEECMMKEKVIPVISGVKEKNKIDLQEIKRDYLKLEILQSYTKIIENK